MFLAQQWLNVIEGFPKPTNNFSPHLYIFNELVCTPNKDCMQKLNLKKLMNELAPSGLAIVSLPHLLRLWF